MALTPGRTRVAGIVALAASGVVGWRIGGVNAAAYLLPVIVPLGLVVARPQRVATGAALVGFVGFVWLSIAEPAEIWPPNVTAYDWGLVAAGLLTAAGMLVYAVRAEPQPRAAPRRRERIAIAVAGATLLAFSLLTGGHFLFYPLWSLAMFVLVVPPLLTWRSAPLVAGALILTVAAGALPVGTCSFDHWSDAIPQEGPPPPVREDVRLYEIGTRGPFWSEGGGFGGLRVTCSDAQVAAGVAWSTLIVALAVFAAWRAPRDEPNAS